jgi:hypothetical protein
VNPIAEAGWAVCPHCAEAFLSVVGARCRCPHCGHTFTVELVTLARPGSFDESKPSGKQWLLRIEIRIARAWAEALAESREARGANPLSATARCDADAADYFRAWQQVRALRFGQQIEFQYPAVKR